MVINESKIKRGNYARCILTFLNLDYIKRQRQIRKQSPSSHLLCFYRSISIKLYFLSIISVIGKCVRCTTDEISMSDHVILFMKSRLSFEPQQETTATTLRKNISDISVFAVSLDNLRKIEKKIKMCITSLKI